MEWLRCFFLLSILVSITANHCICEASTNENLTCMKKLDTFYTVHWLYDPDKESIALALEAETNGWVGFSFAETEGSMIPADAVIGVYPEDDKEPTITAYHLTERSVSDKDKDDSVHISKAQVVQIGNMTTAYFIRQLKGGSIKLDTDADIPINYAIGQTDELEYHGANRGNSTICLSAHPEGEEIEFVSMILFYEIEPVPGPSGDYDDVEDELDALK